VLLVVVFLLMAAPSWADPPQDQEKDALSYIHPLRDLLMGLFDSEEVCRNGAAAPLKPAVCGYLVMSGSFFSFFAYYIAAPCFVALLLWYFYTYVLRLYRGGDDAVVSFFLKRALALLVAFIMVVPARSVLGVNDSRPTALWAIFKAVQGGMELAGKGIDLALGWGEADETIKESIQKARRESNGDSLTYFLVLPLTIEGYMDRSKELLKQMNDKVVENVEEAPDKAVSMRDALYGKWYHKLGGVAVAALGTVLGVASGGTMLVPAIAMTAAGLGSTIFGMAENQILLWFRDALAEPIFNVTLAFAWYAALCVLVVRMMLYGFLGTGMAIFVPMGRWGRQKITTFLSNLIAFILTPIVMAVGWFVALVVRVLYLQISNVVILVTCNVTQGSVVGFFAVFLATMTLPLFFVMPLCYLFFRTPAYLSHVVGNVFSAGMGVAERMRAPLAR
jgi:hypothetical protein